MISFLQLEYFCALARSNSLTRTAEKLFVSQSTLSASIAKLEREVGVPLFDREKNRIYLNENGKAYLLHVQNALNELKIGAQSAREASDSKQNLIKFAASRSGIWKDMVQDFRKDNPHIYIQFKPENLETYAQHLTDNKLDFVITGTDDLADGGVDSRPIASIGLCLCVPPSHPLSGRNSIRLADLENVPYVDVVEGKSFRKFCDALFLKINVSVNRVVECEGEMRSELIREGEGVGLVVDSAITRRFYEGLCFIPVEDEHAARSISLFWKARRKFTPSMYKFYEHVINWTIN